MPDFSDLTDKSVLITGASRGIGEATARHFAALGAHVALTARSSERCQAIAAEIRAAGGTALAIACDVSDVRAVHAAVRDAEAAHGPLDILINNAGVIEPVARLADSDPASWGHAIDINLKGVYHGIHAVLPGMLARGQGTILTIGSGAAYAPLEGWSHYCASKAGALMLTRMVDKEYGARGVRAISLSPGTVATQMQREIKATGINPVSQLDWSDHIPPEWPAKALAWMCGPEAAEHAGQEISLRDAETHRKIGLG